ncbi:serine--tRNA ligase [Patescibacteria group bacterium]|nr:serine--tRNA ligase [Patescibacteria group bacterium]
MLDIKFIRDNKDLVVKNNRSRGVKVDIDKLLRLDEKMKKNLQELERRRAEHNKNSKIKIDDKQKRLQMRKFVESIRHLKEIIVKQTAEIDEILYQIPGLNSPTTPIGKSEEDNQIVKTVGQPTEFNFKPKDYMELAELHDLIDTKRAAKVSGSRFGFLKNQAVEIQFALVNYTLDLLKKEGFIPFITPALVKKEIMEKTGYDTYTRGQDAYFLEKDNLYLVGTGEHALIAYHADEILRNKDLPLRYTTYSSCFRREAGSYGKDTKGILRVHQFDKLEMISLTTPDKSKEEFTFLLSLQEKLVFGLGLPYRLLEVCTGDLPKPSSKVIDLECWLPSENKYRETHSVSNCTDYQARDLNIKFKNQKNNNEYVHILNGTAFAIGRILLVILENYQQADGSIDIPKVLVDYMPSKIKKISVKK